MVKQGEQHGSNHQLDGNILKEERGYKNEQIITFKERHLS